MVVRTDRRDNGQEEDARRENRLADASDGMCSEAALEIWHDR